MDFITPFFKALGWDVENEAGLLHHDREVLVEKRRRGNHRPPRLQLPHRRADQVFRGSQSASEASENPHHILQAKGYVWNTKQVFFVILTDFEEFRFYDASRQPDERKPDEGLLLSLRYSDYPSNSRSFGNSPASEWPLVRSMLCSPKFAVRRACASRWMTFSSMR